MRWSLPLAGHHLHEFWKVVKRITLYFVAVMWCMRCLTQICGVLSLHREIMYHNRVFAVHVQVCLHPLILSSILLLPLLLCYCCCHYYLLYISVFVPSHNLNLRMCLTNFVLPRISSFEQIFPNVFKAVNIYIILNFFIS